MQFLLLFLFGVDTGVNFFGAFSFLHIYPKGKF